MVKVPKKTLERQLFRSGFDAVIGVDEVGMACLAGPVTVCAVRFLPAFYEHVHRKLAGLRDSKALAAHQREYYAAELIASPHMTYHIASCVPTTIDRMNIYQASRHAMRRAIRSIPDGHKRAMVLVDGNKPIEGVHHEQMPIVKGDRSVFAIAAASIIAKVHRDRVMRRAARRYPSYGFERHKGYPTAVHRAALARVGPCALHRKSFRL